MTDHPRRLDLGITVMPEYIQSEGTEAVLHRLVDMAGATSVTTSPYVAARVAEGTGHREPPSDGGIGKNRLLDRPLWGARELWMTAAPSFRPDASLYDGLAYRPPAPDALTEAEGTCVGAFLDAAQARGLETWIQIQAAIPPCYRVQFGGPHPGDESRLPDGQPFPKRVDRNTSLAAPDLRAYLRAIVTDLARAYPQADGFRFDWPEYPVYHFETLFFDFNPAVATFARSAGFDFEGIRTGVLAFLADLGAGHLRRALVALDDLDSFRESLFAACPALAGMLALRRALVSDHARFLRQTVDEATKGRGRMFLQGFPPPLNEATGFDLPTLAGVADQLGVKFYTMHWPLIEADYLRALQTRTDFAPKAIAAALARILRLAPPSVERDPATIRYPEPDEPHPAATEDILAKMRAARAMVPAGTRICGITHSYGPLEDVMRRFDAVAAGADGAVQVNRYGYMTDAKFAAIGDRVRGSVPA
ncbi:MAG: hypothetical protein ACK4RN_14560 [Pseudorhodobacter sp.]